MGPGGVGMSSWRFHGTIEKPGNRSLRAKRGNLSALICGNLEIATSSCGLLAKTFSTNSLTRGVPRLRRGDGVCFLRNVLHACIVISLRCIPIKACHHTDLHYAFIPNIFFYLTFFPIRLWLNRPTLHYFPDFSRNYIFHLLKSLSPQYIPSYTNPYQITGESPIKKTLDATPAFVLKIIVK